MDIYVVETETPKLTPERWLVTAVLYGGFFAVLMFFTDWFRFSSAGRHLDFGAMVGMAVGAGTAGLFYGAFMAFFGLSGPSGYKVIVDGDTITGVTQYAGWRKWLVWRRTVHKGKLRTILDLKSRSGAPRGVILSERNRFGSWIIGSVYIPNTLPEYEDIRRLAKSWLADGGVE